jgi:hypothetical protein
MRLAFAAHARAPGLLQASPTFTLLGEGAVCAGGVAPACPPTPAAAAVVPPELWGGGPELGCLIGVQLLGISQIKAKNQSARCRLRHVITTANLFTARSV